MWIGSVEPRTPKMYFALPGCHRARRVAYMCLAGEEEFERDVLGTGRVGEEVMGLVVRGEGGAEGAGDALLVVVEVPVGFYLVGGGG